MPLQSDSTENSSPILVTGGTGFIGRRVVRALLKIDSSMDVISLSLPGEDRPQEWPENVVVYDGDISSRSDVLVAAKGAKTIIHLAAMLGHGSYEQHESVTVGGTRNILAVARENGARVVVASSIAVYGDHIRERICDERAGYKNYQGPYSYAKQLQEQVTLSAFKKEGVNATIVRPANVYGVASMPWVDVISIAIKMRAPILVDGGFGHAGLVHVDNLADALVMIAMRGDLAGEVFNVCDDMDICWSDYFGDLSRLLDIPLVPSVSYQVLEDIARKDESPEEKIIPEVFNSIPLASLILIGSDNRFPADNLRNLGWQPRVGYQQGINEIREYLNEKAVRARLGLNV